MGAVNGDHSLLKDVTKPKIRPPMAPIAMAGPAKLRSRVCMNEFHVQAAVATAQKAECRSC